MVEELVTNNVALDSVDNLICSLEQQQESAYKLQSFNQLRKDVIHKYCFARLHQQQQTLDRWVF
jgi:hypothetical protein